MAYAHSLIMIGAEVDTSAPPGTPASVLKRHYIGIGKKVTQDQLGVDDATWEMYYRDGVVSDEALPEDLDHENESLNEYRVKRAAQALEEAGKRPERPASRRSQQQKEEK